MGKWYNNNPKNVIDARLAYEGAGAIGRGVASVGASASNYAKLKYKKKRDKLDDANVKNTNDVKLQASQNTLAGQMHRGNSTVKAADIKATSTNRRTTSNEYIADVKSKTELSKASMDYQKSTDTANINKSSHLGAAKMGADSRDRATVAGRKNNINTNSTSRANSKVKAETSKANSNAQDKRQKNNNSFKMKEIFEKQKNKALEDITDKVERKRIIGQYNKKIDGLSQNKQVVKKNNNLNDSW